MDCWRISCSEEASLLVLVRPSNDWMSSTFLIEGDLLSSESAALSAGLIQNHLHKNTQNVRPNTWPPHSPGTQTHKIDHHTHWGKNLFARNFSGNHFNVIVFIVILVPNNLRLIDLLFSCFASRKPSCLLYLLLLAFYTLPNSKMTI